MATGNTSEMFVGVLEFFQADGVTPAVVQGVPTWVSSDETVVTAVPTEDGMGVKVLLLAVGGPARVAATADVDMGPGVQELVITSEDITVTQDPATQASSGRITFGAPVPKA
jgi:hypothetical protein